MLSNNYDITLLKNDWQASSLNNSKANAGIGPRVNLIASDNLSNNNLRQRFTNGNEIKRDFVFGNNFNAGILLNWTIFDGYRMYATKRRLELLEKQGEANYQLAIEASLSQLIKAYYDIARSKLQLQNTERLIQLLNDRLTLAKSRFEIGTASKLDYLQTQVEWRTQENNRLQQLSLIANAKLTLAQLMGKVEIADFDISDSLSANVPFAVYPNDIALTNNQQIIAQSFQKSIAEASVAETRALSKPQVGLQSGYNFAFSQSQAGFSLFNLTHGLFVGLNFSMPIYDAGLNRRQVEVAKLNAQSALTRGNQLRDVITSAYRKAYNDYQLAVQQFENERNTLKIIEELYTIAFERFKVNQSANYLEIKEIQKSLEDSRFRQVSTLYEAKLAEIELLKFQGKLLTASY